MLEEESHRIPGYAILKQFSKNTLEPLTHVPELTFVAVLKFRQ